MKSTMSAVGSIEPNLRRMIKLHDAEFFRDSSTRLEGAGVSTRPGPTGDINRNFKSLNVTSNNSGAQIEAGLLDQVAYLVHDRLRRGVDFPDLRRDRGAVLRVHVEFLFFGIGQKISVLHRGH